MLDHRVIIARSYFAGPIGRWFDMDSNWEHRNGALGLDIAQDVRRWLDENTAQRWRYVVEQSLEDGVHFIICFDGAADAMLFRIHYGIFDEA